MPAAATSPAPASAPGPVPELGAILDHVLVPRRNGSEGLAQVAHWLETTLRGVAPDVQRQVFEATPHGFELVWCAALALVVGWAICLLRGRPRTALALALAAPLLLLAEFEALRSPVSGLWTQPEANVVARFPARAGAPTLVFVAHYDTATHLGDHYTWYAWGWALAPATALTCASALGALWLARRGRRLPRAAALACAALAPIPYAAMALFQSAGPHLRAPSPGALDNGGSVAALVRLAGRLSGRGSDAPVAVELVFPAAEEERALGSWHYAAELAPRDGAVVVNLEAVGASRELAWIAEDGFEFRRWRTPGSLLAFADEALRRSGLPPPPRAPLLGGTLTDARSFLAHGIPAVTLASLEDGGFPRGLHSARDERGRLSPGAIEAVVDRLAALVAHADRHPDRLRAVAGSPVRAAAPGSDSG